MSKPRPPVVVEARAGNWFTNGGWYPLVSLLTFGLGSFVPFTVAAKRLQRPGLRSVGIGYSLVPFVAFMVIGGSPDDAVVVPSVALTSVFAAMIAAASQLIVLSRRPGAGRSPQLDPALARALGARARREETRALAFADPLLAQDLRVGRPDLEPEYDDGGLVDLNNAPAATIASVCGIKRALATAIVELREQHGAFASVDEMLVLGDLPVSVWDRIRDRAVLLN
ncbi:MAG TPA: helix-hairpin-helix domain-containing protein [Pseudonocardiaceae bacterium]|nr:helix-hairpin-helix domain-containing protein [Pseudonocardiaceae bacterium]